MFRKSNFKSKLCKLVVLFFMFQFVFSYMTSANAFIARDSFPQQSVPMTCKTLGEWTNKQNVYYSESLGSSIIFRKYIEETGTYSINFSNVLHGIKYEIFQNAVSWRVGYGDFSSLPGCYNLNKDTYISVVFTVASKPIEISTISFTKLTELPPMPVPSQGPIGVPATYNASDLVSNNPNLVRNDKYDCITELNDGDEIILNNVTIRNNVPPAKRIPLDTLVVCAAVDEENDGTTISGFEGLKLQSTGGRAPEFLEQVFTGELQSYSDGLVKLKIEGGKNVCDIKWIKLFFSAYPDGKNFSFSLYEAPETVKEIIGDLSGDGVVNAIDFAYMRQYLLGIRYDISLFVADFDGDLRITAVDFATFRSWLLGR